MAVKPGGLFYAPSPPPQTGEGRRGDPITQWMTRELDRIADVLREGRSQGLRLDVLKTLPPRPQSGMVGYFRAGVAGAGEGLYEYRAGAWAKL
jgi:hypothetical protein